MSADYISLHELRSFIGRGLVDDDSLLYELCTTASRWVDSQSGRRFYRDLPRAVADGATTINDATVTSATAAFTAADVGMTIAGTGIPASTTILTVTNTTTVELSANATATGTGVTLTLSSTPRLYRPTTSYQVDIDDAVGIATVEVDLSDTGTFTAFTAYQTLPLNGVGPNGAPGWPVRALRAVDSQTFPIYHRRPAIRVTPTAWGWQTVPPDVKTATYYKAHRLFFLRDTPGGTTESIEFGAQPIRSVFDIEKLLSDYTTLNAAGSRFLVG